MKKILTISVLTFLIPFMAEAKNCGHYMHKNIKTYGGLSCKQAKSVYKAFSAGHTPKGWTCGQSVKGCGIDKKGFTFE